jgi:cytochrome c oxidase assembly factor CtaG
MDISYWSANVAVLAVYLVAATAHLRGMRGAATGAVPGQSRPPGRLARAVAYQAGLLLALLAVVSPMGYWSYRFIWVRDLQDVMLAIAAPALIVLGAPWLPLSRGLGLSGRLRRLERSGEAEDEAGPVVQPGWQTLPILVTVAFCALWWVWHLPGPFDAAVTSSLAYAAEVVTYLAVGILFWLQLVESPPLRPRLAPLNRVALVVGAAASCTVLGLIRVYGPGLAYPAYLGLGHRLASVVAYQQVGGAILWVIPLIPFSIVAVALVVRWLKDEEAEATDADFDRLLKHKSAWPSRPGLR